MSVTTRSKAKAATEDLGQTNNSPVQPAKSNPMEKLRYKLLEKVAAGTPVIEKLQVITVNQISHFREIGANS